MNDLVRFRRARATEPHETYAFVVAWPIVWILPYGIWTWAIIWMPDLLVYAVRRLWRGRAPIVASAKRSGSGVALLDESGRRIEGFEDSDIDSVTTLVDTKRRTIDLRVDRKAKPALLFEVGGDDDAAAVAKRLGIDIQRARSRYRGGSLALRPLALPFIAGLCCLGYALFGKPDAETALWLVRINQYAFLPIVLLINIPTVIDIGRDGVAWRWLFIRRHLAFSSIASMQPQPRGATGMKVASMQLVTRGNLLFHLPLGKHAEGAAADLLAAFAASRQAAEPAAPVDDWVPRMASESALAWIQRLRVKTAAGATYRGADVQHLWALAEELSTPRDLRCAMLFVLATTDVARARTRALAAQIVDPEVQAVCEAIANRASDEQLAPLLERVSSAA